MKNISQLKLFVLIGLMIFLIIGIILFPEYSIPILIIFIIILVIIIIGSILENKQVNKIGTKIREIGEDLLNSL